MFTFGHDRWTTDSWILMRFKEKLFHCKDSQAAKHSAQGACAVSLLSGRETPGETSRPKRINPQAMWSEAYLALCRSLSQRSPEPFHLSYSVILITSPSILLNIMAAPHSSLHLCHHPKQPLHELLTSRQNAQASKLRDLCNILIFLRSKP